jgi:type II secretory pathway predicted ATPase ExeA
MLFTNTDVKFRSPLTLILLGQPTLRRDLKLGRFVALDQRIGLRYHLEGQPLDETVAYVKRHLASGVGVCQEFGAITHLDARVDGGLHR